MCVCFLFLFVSLLILFFMNNVLKKLNKNISGIP